MFGRRKFHNQKTTVDGILFDSKAEAARYITLKARVAKGEIRSFQIKPKYRFASGITYTADFSFYDVALRQTVVEDVKGFVTPEFRLKKRLMKHEHNVEVQEIKMDSRTANTLLAAHYGLSNNVV